MKQPLPELHIFSGSPTHSSDGELSPSSTPITALSWLHARHSRPSCACWAAALAALLLFVSALHSWRDTGAIYVPLSISGTANSHTAFSSSSSSSQPWCPAQSTAGDPATPFPTDLWFVKTPKTGGTTLSGVLRTICAQTGIVGLKWNMASDATSVEQLRGHMQAAYNWSATGSVAILTHMRYSEAKAALFRRPPLMLTAVRHPVARLHSNFVQQLCTQHAHATQLSPNECDTNATFMQQALRLDSPERRAQFARDARQQNELFRYVRGSATTVKEAAATYDFMFVSERMNEALVVFMLDYGLRFEDIAYLSSKNRTGKYRRASEQPQELNQLIEASNQHDLQLWQLANQQLDARVKALQRRCGEGVVAAALATFELLLREVQRQCGDYQAWYAAHGFGPPYAYEGDRGLGNRCVRHTVRRRLEASSGG